MLAGISQTIYCQTKAWQDIVIDDVLEKHGIRIEGFPVQDDAFIKIPIFTNGPSPVRFRATVSVSIQHRCEPAHKTEIRAISDDYSIAYSKESVPCMCLWTGIFQQHMGVKTHETLVSDVML